MAQTTTINNFTKRLLDKVLAKLLTLLYHKRNYIMNNLQIIAVGTLISVTLIESSQISSSEKLSRQKRQLERLLSILHKEASLTTRLEDVLTLTLKPRKKSLLTEESYGGIKSIAS